MASEDLGNAYGYAPTKSVAIAFVVLFSISTVGHIVQATARKQWFLFATAIFCGILEVVGWSARLKSHFDPFDLLPYQIQTVATVLGPTPLLAANFVIFGRIIRVLGTDYSRLSPRWYTGIFCTIDVLSLFIQGGGGAVAAINSDTLEGANKGGLIMLGGIILHVVAIVFYALLAVEYYIRFVIERPLNKINLAHKHYTARGRLTKRIELMLVGLTFNTLCLFVRALYRTVELAEGWGGRILRTEIYFNWLDGAMIVLALWTFNIFHPGWLLASNERETGEEDGTRYAMLGLNRSPRNSE
ncbi:hypothetical protein CC1G_06708 [Coprinopsis cinerea okayama7|uniref:RTA1-domain-containing protein n=1 Tax=Coprinopsis cinerea (strain Okayama-7 / 130 / ATCC MYA-4618 / FGSC 9003) TaxID=240176 RepID=A8P838_COPC7|nr:hypothetical protein CC1G_06708 [Coprinopsis cinerea okayama7\|eukprot:XP_001839495.1 hypothetical protein CC1G_06708 [Coprinopsis cinerea okayama7\